MTSQLREAVRAAQDRKALELDVLNLEGISSFTDYFLICTGTSTRHTLTICDAISEGLEEKGFSAAHIVVYSLTEKFLHDYIDFVVHIFINRPLHCLPLKLLYT